MNYTPDECIFDMEEAMEISRISGADTVPGGFSADPPRAEEPAKRPEPPRERAAEPETSGRKIDTYA